ncbi:uncharacterized protein EKO05_0005388 [Ascochyta rabiei]|uniref:Response to stress n=1 Tax=Didymella rabiei TaxID=5454 RepID=A0A163JX85_DIDRA|nr:uncharacterized protein EKO05_0005388 [Ascochyta rabiei]KZM26651.1 response to stress [Ascochyta rabiei]UPX14917.1 hypothetical protein EKO05_0005388 [Ascochyta rabiei]
MANPPSSSSFDWKMYRYTPSLPLAALFLALFTILTLLQVWAYVRHRKTSIVYIIIGGLCEIAGFSARIGSHYDNEAWVPFIIQGTLLLIGPLFFAATVYMMLGRIINLANASAISRISPRWYTRIFVTADISTLVVQGLGASLMGTMQLSLALAGEKVVITGLALQVATFIVFLAAAIDCNVRLARMKRDSDSDATNTSNDAWKSIIHTLYTISALVLFRCVFRLIEYTMGNAAYLIAHEWTLYVFDGVPMFAVLVLFFVYQQRAMKSPKGEGRVVDDLSDEEKVVVGSQ